MAKKDRVICVYDALNGYLLVAQFDNLQEMADYFGKSKKEVTCIISRKTKIKNRYLVEYVEID